MQLPKGVIPFSWEDIKLGDRIYHKFGGRYTIFLGVLYGIQPRIDGENALYISKQSDLIQPKYWNLYIDRRGFRRRLFSSF